MHGHGWPKDDSRADQARVQGDWTLLLMCVFVILLSLLSAQHVITPLAPSLMDSQTHEVPQKPQSLLYSQDSLQEESAHCLVPR